MLSTQKTISLSEPLASSCLLGLRNREEPKESSLFLSGPNYKVVTFASARKSLLYFIYLFFWWLDSWCSINLLSCWYSHLPSPNKDSGDMCLRGNAVSVRDGWSLKIKFVDEHRMWPQTKPSRPLSVGITSPDLSSTFHAMSTRRPALPSLLGPSARDSFKPAPYGFEIILQAVPWYKIPCERKYFQMWVFILTSPHLIAREIWAYYRMKRKYR